MKGYFIVSVAMSVALAAALPPKYQNAKDLDVMVKYIKKNEKVLERLRYIDFQNHVIYYGRKRKAVFGRKKLYRPPGLVGPAVPLEFKRTICSPDSDR